MIVSVNYVNIDNRTLVYCLVVSATVGQRQRQLMVAVGGGDGGNAPSLLLMYGTGDIDRWPSSCGGVGVVFLVGIGVRRQFCFGGAM